MTAKKKASVTEANGKVIVHMTEKDNENKNHMEIKLIQMSDDRLSERCPSRVTPAAKNKARNVMLLKSIASPTS
jgi:hypothetical protein